MSRFASIHPNGDIYACQELTSNDGQNSIFWIGNIRESGLCWECRIKKPLSIVSKVAHSSLSCKGVIDAISSRLRYDVTIHICPKDNVLNVALTCFQFRLQSTR